MIIKSYARKTASFSDLVHYIASERNHSEQPIRLFRFLPSRNLEDVIRAFQLNDQYRLPRKNGNTCYHSILSFHHLDAPLLDADIMRDLALQYIKLRAPLAPCFAQSHYDKKHPHIHFIFAGNQYKSRVTTRQSRKDFYQLRVNLETYQAKHYPQLKRSLVYQRMKDFSFLSIQCKLLPLYEKAGSLSEFKELVEDALEEFLDVEKRTVAYEGKVYPLIDLGIDLSILERLKELQNIRDIAGQQELEIER